MELRLNETDLARLMDDQAVRIDSVGRLQKRNFILQQLLSRVQGLSDEDFESAFTTFSSMIATLEAKRKKAEEEKERLKGRPKELIQELSHGSTQNRGKKG
ncbi:MAG: hypothetical protein RIR26_2572 [Pseudomonadota bacterium]|jgi:hypothetical protein